jgi:hypothetical protein
MFRIKNRGVSQAGWYVAHIFPVKPDKRRAEQLTHRERVARFIRNVHPANHFYFPRPSRAIGRLYGEHSQVIQYVAALYREPYAAIWPEFLELAMAKDFPSESAELGDLCVHFHLRASEATVSQARTGGASSQAIMGDNCCESANELRGRHSIMRERRFDAQTDTKQLCELLRGDCRNGDLNWVGNDTSQRQQTAVARENAISVVLRLSWRASKDSPKSFIGCYRLNLPGLEAGGYIRKEAKSGKYRILIVHDSDNELSLQLNDAAPRIRLGRFV